MNVSGLNLASGDANDVTIGTNELTIDPSAHNHLAVGESEVIASSFNVVDGNGGRVAQTAAITITGANDGPVVNNLSMTIAEDQVLSDSLLTAATDVDGDELTFSLDSGVNHGSLILNADGTFNYTPAIGYFGSDAFSYSVDDGNGGTDSGTVQLTINNLVDLSGLVFKDLNNDGLFDPDGLDDDLTTHLDNEIGLPGVRMQLWTDDLSFMIDEVFTDADGQYGFDANLENGSYRILQQYDDAATPDDVEDEFLLFGLVDGDESAGSLGGIVNNTLDSNVIATIQVGDPGTSADGLGYDFAEIPASSLQGLVWEVFKSDADAALTEMAIHDVSITLTGTDDRGNSVNESQLTNEDGIYEFVALRPGNYSIQQSQPSSFVVDGQTVNLIDGQDVVGEVEGAITGDNDGGDPPLALVNNRFNNVLMSKTVVSSGGLGSMTINIGNYGEAFGVANHSDVLVMDLLMAVNDQSHNGLLFDTKGDGCLDWGERQLRFDAWIVFRWINWQGYC